eukprot:TRINITY_DN1509_c0_g2_i1.p1 TRINITY_DN1509_c0_g2~~TRINITY_DN1509_c0_g2_i1.p1  ORF type:complete len:171 (+),score=88.04 TRINITY_DN1509_c0_g2_i1:67-579(+)
MENKKAVYMIAACSENKVIGKNGKLPWSIPEDWQYFLDCSSTGILVMGRHSFSDMPSAPQRSIIVITSDGQAFIDKIGKPAPLLHTARNVREALDIAQQLEVPGPIWICGGTRVYEDCLPFTDKLYLTHVHAIVEGDTYFPDWTNHFKTKISQRDSRDENYSYSFCIYEH